jgi:hypothetical protein
MSKKKKETTKKDVEVKIEETVEEVAEVKKETLEKEETIEKTVEESKSESKATTIDEAFATGTFRGSLTGMESTPEPEEKRLLIDGVGQAIGYTISGYKILNDSTLIIELGSSRLIRISPDGKVAFRKKL